MIKLASVIGALLLAPTATIFLFISGDAHVIMCMFGAIILSIGLLLNAAKPSEAVSKAISFFGGWVFLYTIVTGSTYLFYEWFADGSISDPTRGFDPVYIYHFLINFAVLIIFWLKITKPKAFYLGINIALLASPVMIITKSIFSLRSFMESNLTILAYVITGLLMLVLYFTYLKNLFEGDISKEKFNRLTIYLLFDICIFM